MIMKLVYKVDGTRRNCRNRIKSIIDIGRLKYLGIIMLKVEQVSENDVNDTTKNIIAVVNL